MSPGRSAAHSAMATSERAQSAPRTRPPRGPHPRSSSAPRAVPRPVTTRSGRTGSTWRAARRRAGPTKIRLRARLSSDDQGWRENRHDHCRSRAALLPTAACRRGLAAIAARLCRPRADPPGPRRPHVVYAVRACDNPTVGSAHSVNAALASTVVVLVLSLMTPSSEDGKKCAGGVDSAHAEDGRRH
jgi:hypothetical protein